MRLRQPVRPSLRVPVGLVIALGACTALARAAQPPAVVVPTTEQAAEAQRVFEGAVADQIAAEKSAPAPNPELLRRAAAAYSRVLELRPDAVAALYNLGRAQAALGDLENAARSFELAASRPGPGRVFYLRQWADFLRRLGRWDDAAPVYEQVVLLEPRLEEPHALLRERYLALRDRQPDRLPAYLWRLVDGRQADRSADLAVDALDAGWPEHFRPELLAAVAASLAQWHETPEEVLESPVVRRLRRYADDPQLGRGVAELVQLYASPGRYPDHFEWWNSDDDDWIDTRGLARRDAFRAVLRALGDRYRAAAAGEVAAGCYRAAIELGLDSDPRALRSLATMYVEQNDMRALDALAARYADPAGAMFEGKRHAYQEGKLDQVLDYHRALGQIFGALAASGKDGIGWGSADRPASALFQLQHAYDIARQLDERDGPAGASGSTHLDPGLTVLYAQGLQATGADRRGTEVLLEADKKFEQVGDRAASLRVLRAVPRERLPEDRRLQLERYEQIERQPRAVEPVAETPARSPAAEVADPARLSSRPAEARTAAVQVANTVVTATSAPASPPSGSRAAATEPTTARSKTPVATTREWQQSVAAVTRTYQDPALLRKRPPTTGTTIVELPATVEWLDTGVDVAAAQILEITATGRWSISAGSSPLSAAGQAQRGTGTIVADAPAGALVGRVGPPGQGTAFPIGENFSGRSPAAGRLYLAINDGAGAFGDNQGSVRVTIRAR